MSELKTVKTRDSAAAILRKMGVAKEMYGKLIRKLDDGRHQVDLTEAQANVAVKAVKEVAAKTVKDLVSKAGKPKAKQAPKKPKAEKPPRPKRVTVTSVTEDLILDGKSNPEVWAKIKEQFKLSDDKRWYPSWFRSRLKREGRLIVTKSGKEG